MQVQCRILSEEEKQVIHKESLRILEDVGVLFHSRKALKILEANGAKVDQETKVARIPEEMVTQALASAPKSFTLGARVPENDFRLPSSFSGYVLDNGGIYIRDFRTGERRTTTFQDHIDLLRVFDEMRSASILWPSTLNEFDPRVIIVKTAITSFMYSSLHVQDELYTPEDVPFILEALEAILGSAQAVRERKIYSVVYCTTPPLTHDAHMCDAYLELTGYEVPICVYPMPCAGSTGPASLFSNIALANAEALSALVLFQMARPGTPIIFGDASGSTDFRTGNFLEGSPEMVLQTGARGEMAKFYGLPNEVAGCLTDAREQGPQAVLEKVLTTLPLVLNGTDLIQGPGALETSNMMSLEQIVVDDEIAFLCRRIRDGVDTSAEKNFFDDIAAIKPGGHFLGRANTRKACRSSEFVTPTLCDRNPLNQWIALGRPDMYKKARRRVEEILSSPQKNPLSGDLIGKLEGIARKADQVLIKGPTTPLAA
jgi:trimethylamine--corrinoid protein Co-methyltransferase